MMNNSFRLVTAIWWENEFEWPYNIYLGTLWHYIIDKKGLGESRRFANLSNQIATNWDVSRKYIWGKEVRKWLMERTIGWQQVISLQVLQNMVQILHFISPSQGLHKQILSNASLKKSFLAHSWISQPLEGKITSLVTLWVSWPGRTVCFQELSSQELLLV